MTNEKMSADWAIERAFEEAGDVPDLPWIKDQGHAMFYGKAILKLARYIEAHEKPPVDRKMLCAREAMARAWECEGSQIIAQGTRGGERDGVAEVSAALEAITLWEEGFGG